MQVRTLLLAAASVLGPAFIHAQIGSLPPTLVFTLQAPATLHPYILPGVPLGKSRLTSAFQKQVIQDLLGAPGPPTFQDPDEAREALDDVYVRRFRIGPSLPPVIRVEGRSDYLCGAHSSCPILFYNSSTRLQVLSAGGSDLKLRPGLHQGAHDILVDEAISCCEENHYLYRFNGHRYKLLRKTTTTHD